MGTKKTKNTQWGCHPPLWWVFHPLSSDVNDAVEASSLFCVRLAFDCVLASVQPIYRGVRSPYLRWCPSPLSVVSVHPIYCGTLSMVVPYLWWYPIYGSTLSMVVSYYWLVEAKRPNFVTHECRMQHHLECHVFGMVSY